MDIQEQKSQARKIAFANRKLAFGTVQADLIAPILELSKDANVIASYMPMRTEIDPLPAMKALYEKGKRVVVPVILGAARPLVFHEWTPEAEMVAGEFGALIPKDGQVLEPDFVLAPLVAYDKAGTRLGYGGGFYDRTIEGLRANANVPYIGLAFEAQCADEALPFEVTDIRLDAVITENGVIKFHP